MKIHNNRAETRSTANADVFVTSKLPSPFPTVSKIALWTHKHTRMVLHWIRHRVRVDPHFLHVHPLEGIAKVVLA